MGNTYLVAKRTQRDARGWGGVAAPYLVAVRPSRSRERGASREHAERGFHQVLVPERTQHGPGE
tara:strand:+ start:1049 stop:1240 length:192 start_codon:yes stop_codon:yes gene_type:complete